MEKVLVTGGAGYIGSIVCRLLLKEGYAVRTLDSLMFGGESIIELMNDPNFELITGDIRDKNTVDQALEGVQHVAHLAAIVGDPACAVDPELTKAVNLDASKYLFEKANANGVKKLVFSSTCSNYGKMSDPKLFLNEESELSPVSLYAETKVAYEQFLLGHKGSSTTNPTCLRFSTVYGLSPRMRFDLTVNEFTKELALGRELVIFGEQFWRPYCHVLDLARSVVAVIKADNDKVAFEVFNVGNTKENYTKKMLVEEISKVIEGCEIKYVQKNEDPRDYRVNFDKIKRVLDFDITYTVPEGIVHLYKVIKVGVILNPDDDKFRNS